MNLRKLTTYICALYMTAGVISVNSNVIQATVKYGTGQNLVEYLDRGIYAVKSGNGMFVSWRLNADDADNAEFRLYRNDQLIYTSKTGTGATCFQDNGGNLNSIYRVDAVVNGSVVSSEDCHLKSGTNCNYSIEKRADLH